MRAGLLPLTLLRIVLGVLHQARPLTCVRVGTNHWLLLIVLLAGCCPKPETIRMPGPVEYRDRIVVEPIPPELLIEHPIATGGVAACPDVARKRRAELDKCNQDKAALRTREAQP